MQHGSDAKETAVTSSEYGRLGEARVISELVKKGWYPFVDISGKCPVDIVAWKDGQTVTIQVKSSTVISKNGKWVVQIGATRSNKTSNVVKNFDNTAQEYLAIHLSIPDVVVFVKSDTITTKREFQVDQARASDL